LQDAITARRRSELVGREMEVLVDAPGVARSHREAPEIDGIVVVPGDLAVGEIVTVRVTGSAGPDLEAEPVALADSPRGRRTGGSPGRPAGHSPGRAAGGSG
ncbi:MAG: TRAM domain-containing protein, partial [Acidimicrobiales bacterium]